MTTPCHLHDNQASRRNSSSMQTAEKIARWLVRWCIYQQLTATKVSRENGVTYLISDCILLLNYIKYEQEAGRIVQFLKFSRSSSLTREHNHYSFTRSLCTSRTILLDRRKAMNFLTCVIQLERNKKSSVHQAEHTYSIFIVYSKRSLIIMCIYPGYSSCPILILYYFAIHSNPFQ